MKARIDALQYCNWNRERFLEMQKGGLHAVHATVCYHENFRETEQNIARWNDMFAEHEDLIMPGRCAEDVIEAQNSGRTAIFFGFQNCSPLEGDIRMIETCAQMGARFMQLTYNEQSLLACGYTEESDGGVTRMGREVIAEMNRVGMVIDLSHAGEKSAIQGASLSRRPVAITHATPSSWHPSPRGVSDDALRALADNGGMLGLSLYPRHLKDGGECSLKSFCEMTAQTATIIGAGNIGIGSDLCRGQPAQVLQWMRAGKWQKNPEPAGDFPNQPKWFESSEDFNNLATGLRETGFSEDETDGILGENWLRFFRSAFLPAS